MLARTDAHALHDLLDNLRACQKPLLQHAWAEVLGAPFGQPEFARRHTEAAVLLDSTLRAIEALPDPRTRSRYGSYANSWWTAVIGPTWQWGAQIKVEGVLSQDHLNLLAAAADTISSHYAGTAAAPNSLDLARVGEQCAEWRDLLESTDLAQSLKLGLREKLEQLQWLLDNAERFGAARVAQAGEQALGAIALASPQVPAENQTTWKQKMTNLAGVLIILTYASDAMQKAIESGGDLVETVMRMLH